MPLVQMTMEWSPDKEARASSLVQTRDLLPRGVSLARASRDRALASELGDLVRQARHLAARVALVNDAVLGGAHQLRLGCLESGQSLLLVAARDRILDATHVAAHARAAPLVHFGAARDLAGRLLGGLGIGHLDSVGGVPSRRHARDPFRAIATAEKTAAASRRPPP